MSMTEREAMDGEIRVPPSSEVAEQSVLGALLLDNTSFDRISGSLSEGDFFDHRHRMIFAAIAMVLARHSTADVISVYEYLRDTRRTGEIDGVLVYLNALAQSVTSAANIRRHANIVSEKAAQRALIAATDEACALAWQASSAAEAQDQIAALFNALQAKAVRKMPRRLSEIAVERTAYYEDLAAGRIAPGWRTHIPRLTSMMNGGFRPGALYILAARPAMGKSSFSADLAMHLAGDDLPTLFLSQEMPDADVADRAVANAGCMDYSALLSGRMQQEDWSRVVEAVESIGARPLYVDDQASLTLRDIRAKACAVPGLRLLIIDYLQLCASGRKDGNRNAEIEEISRGLKTLAKELGIAVLALSQLNRDVEKRPGRRPTLADLRDSGAIEQDADMVMFLWPVRDEDDQGMRVIGCGIDKNRQGKTGQFGLDFHGSTQRWRESGHDVNASKAQGKRFE